MQSFLLNITPTIIYYLHEWREMCNFAPKLCAEKCGEHLKLCAEKCSEHLEISAEKCILLMERTIIQQLRDWK